MLGISDYPAFVGAVIIFLAIPGPGNLALLAATAHGGRKGGVGATFGVMAGDQVLMWAAVAGLAAVLQASAFWFNALQWAGALYLVYLGEAVIGSRVCVRGAARFSPKYSVKRFKDYRVIGPALADCQWKPYATFIRRKSVYDRNGRFGQWRGCRGV